MNNEQITPEQRLDFPKDGKNNGIRYVANLDKLGCLKLIERHLIGFDWEDVPFNLSQLIANAFNDGSKYGLSAPQEECAFPDCNCKMAYGNEGTHEAACRNFYKQKKEEAVTDEIGFMQGYSAALKCLYEFEGQQPSTVVMEVFRCNQIKVKDFDKYRIDEIDRPMLIHLNKEHKK